MTEPSKASPFETQSGSSVQELLEILASQVHRTILRKHPPEIWEVRSKPVSYADLPELFKGYERAAAIEILDDLKRAGYVIEAPHSPISDLEEVQQKAEAFIKQGEPLQAYDVISAALKDWPEDLTLRQLRALTLIRSGAPRKAMEMLQDLLEDGNRDQGTLAPLARAHRDLADQTRDPRRRHDHLEMACDLYVEAYRANQGIWSGIQVATLTFLLDRGEEAEGLARAVETTCREMHDAYLEEGKDSFWLVAVLAQAALLQGHMSQALAYYGEVSDRSSGRLGDLAELRHIAQGILHHRGEDASAVEALFPVPKVVVFNGHMVDFADRRTPRFPPEVEGAVAAAIADRLSKIGAGSGFASASCGSAILFHEAMLERGGEIHVVLPYDRKEFLADSVLIRPDGDWASRFGFVLDQARWCISATSQRLDSGSIPFQFANLQTLGLAKIRTQQLHTEMVPMVVWDGQPSDVPGSTAWTLASWQELGHSVEVIDLAALSGGHVDIKVRAPGPPRPAPVSPGGLTSRILLLLFADVVNFSQLEELQIPLFVEHFLGAVRTLEKEMGLPVLFRNTWGDGLFFVFESVADAARFGQALVRRMSETRWAKLGLPEGMNLRVAIHAGPVYLGEDPVTGNITCFGSNVNRAARIEPITPPGQVYVSQAFAALATAQNVPDFTCEYVGLLPLAKNFGTFPMYLLRMNE